VCPVEAIYYEDDVPEEWSVFYNVNVEFFNDIGSPGGASKLGPTGKDHPYVAALPPQNTGE
jgi:ferredoxin